MGDSFCQAESVDDDQTCCALLERELARQLRQHVWVGNCGHGGRDAADYLYAAPVYEWKLRPDLILLTFTLSDFRLASPHMLPGLAAQFDTAASPGQGLKVRPVALSRQQAMGERLAPNLQRLARGGRPLGPYPVRHRTPRRRDGREGADGRRHVPDLIDREEQIASVEQMERYFADLLARTNTPVACAYIAPWSPFRHPNNHFHAVAEQRLRAAASRLGIPFVPTGPALRDYVERTGQPANGFANTVHGPGRGHLNPTGHQLVARTLAPPVTRVLARGPMPQPQMSQNAHLRGGYAHR